MYGAFQRLKDDSTVVETEMADTSVGDRLPYNDYTTIDQLHDLVFVQVVTSSGGTD